MPVATKPGAANRATNPMDAKPVEGGAVERDGAAKMQRVKAIAPAGLAGALLLVALWAGLARLGWVPAPAHVAAAHGALMVCGFLGTLISLERASALDKPGFLAVPALAALGGFSLLAGLPQQVGQALWATAAAGLILMFRYIHQLQPALHTRVIAAGAGLWLVGNALWLGGLPLAQVVPWWAGFLIFTIVGERLELTRLRRPSRSSTLALLSALALLAAGLVASAFWPDLGFRVIGAALLAQGVWLLTQDIARRTIRQPGATRFIAACLIAGYAWLAAAGGLWLSIGAQLSGFRFDAMLHGVFVGFVMSMIFGHALIIMPGVLGVEIPFRPWFYSHLLLLHLSLLVRVASAFTGPGPVLVPLGGLLNVAAVLLFLFNSGRAAAGAMATKRRGWPWPFSRRAAGAKAV